MNLFVLTGAGISAESGLATFRDADGLWERHRVSEIATPKAFVRAPDLVRRFYDSRRRALLSAKPNAAHLALAHLETALSARGGTLFLCIQNIDELHERAGSRNVTHMHGELRKARCTACAQVVAWTGDMAENHTCPQCGRPNVLRPHVVWFGEMPLEMDRIEAALAKADLFVAIGTSGIVYPAAALVEMAFEEGARTLEINLQPSGNAQCFEACRIGPASVEVPRWVDEVLAGL